MREAERRIDVDEQPENKQHGSAANNSRQQLRSRGSGLKPLIERESNRDTDDPQKRRENGIGKRPAVPFRVFERSIGIGTAAVVYQYHEKHGCAPKGVE